MKIREMNNLEQAHFKSRPAIACDIMPEDRLGDEIRPHERAVQKNGHSAKTTTSLS